MKGILFTISVCLLSIQSPAQSDLFDPRNIRSGLVIPDLSYSDQPYIVKTDDGAWLVCLTTGAGHEGESGQTVITQRSLDRGKTWTDLVEVEPHTGPEASYAVMLKAPSGRIYIFYNHNTDNLRELRTVDGGTIKRVDSQGYFVFKYSDDHGVTWSEQRYPIPIREFQIDRENVYQGEVRFFWNVGKPFQLNGKGYVPLIKVGNFGPGFFTRNEGALLMSKNILTENNPENISWETLPDGEVGLRAPEGGGPIAGEQSYTVMSDGSIYCVYRTIDGFPVNTYSRDGGHTWSAPAYKTYANGNRMKHPRAANFVWRCSNGNYLYWYHNHGGKFIPERMQGMDWYPYQFRNPIWVSGGMEVDTPDGKMIQWSQPEILLYDDDPLMRISYPDLVEQDGNYYITETQKMVARVHQVNPHLLNKLWGQFENKQVTQDSLVLELTEQNSIPREVKMPELSPFRVRGFFGDEQRSQDQRHGFTIEVKFSLESLEPGQILLDNRTETGDGFLLRTSEQASLELVINDEQTQTSWQSDPQQLETDKTHHAVIIVDGGPKIISYVIDGILNDGGAYRQFGWGWFSPYLRDANGSDNLKIGPSIMGQVESLRIYDRYLLTSEAIGNYRAGM